MWKVWHWLFGWDYVWVNFDFDDYVRKVRKTPNGIEYIMIYGYKVLLANPDRSIIHITRKV